jgi:hypothetical protein
MMKEHYLMSDHSSGHSQTVDRNDSTWWSGDVSKGTKFWGVMDWISICSSLAYVLPMMAMSTIFKGDETGLSKEGNKNIAYRKCIQFMIWCFNIRDNVNNELIDHHEKVLLTLESPMYVILDSGSTAHVVRDISLLSNVKRMSKPVQIGGVEHGGQGIV